MRNEVVFNLGQWDFAHVQGWVNWNLHDESMTLLDDET